MEEFRVQGFRNLFGVIRLEGSGFRVIQGAQLQGFTVEGIGSFACEVLVVDAFGCTLAHQPATPEQSQSMNRECPLIRMTAMKAQSLGHELCDTTAREPPAKRQLQR